MAQYFNLTLDTTAPSSGILSGLNSYYNSNATVTISADGAFFMKVWTNQTAIGTLSDTQVPSSWEAYNTSKTVSFTGQGTQYVHAVFMDEVGNIGPVVNSDSTVYDNATPTISSVSINNNDGYTKNPEVTVRVSFGNSTSGIDKIFLQGNLAQGATSQVTLTNADRTAGYKDITTTLASNTDGLKTIVAYIIDRADNVSNHMSDTIILDTTAATGTLVLRNEGDTANLAAYVKDRKYIAKVITQDNDIIGYKIWEGNTEPANWTTVNQIDCPVCNGTGFTNASGPNTPCANCYTSGKVMESDIVVTNLQLSTDDGSKTIHAKIQDVAGNVTTLTPITVVLDTTAPTVTLSANKSVISAVSGYNSVTFTCGATDTNSSEGLTYALKLGSSVIKSGTFTSSVAVTQSEIEAISSGQGTKSFTLEVTDIAGNTGTSSAVVITLDKTAPTGSIIANTYYNSQALSFTISGSDTGGAVLEKMRVYIDSETGTWENYTSGAYSKVVSLSQGPHTVHVKFRDSVGNESTVYDASFTVDTAPPTGSISTVTYTNSRTITVSTASITDNISGVGYMKVWEDGQTIPTEWEAYAISKSITLVEGSDGLRTIKAAFKDNAGNTSAILSCTTTLDLDEPDAVLNLLKTDGNGLPAKVNYRNFKVRISHTAPDTSPIAQYKLSGDFDQSSTDWQVFTYDSGQTYMTVSDLTLTNSNGLKTITLQLKDAAGNVSSAVDATVTYDTAPPVIDVNAPDYNIVSKQRTLRLNASGSPITGKYNDMCIFTWSANENLAAYKVCVNTVGQTAETAIAIGTTNGSLNMSGGATPAAIPDPNDNSKTIDNVITSTIFGADFAATEAVNDTDGVYEIIVYGQDEGGTWSAIHALS